MSKVKNAIEQLKKIGYTDEKIAELLELLLPDVQDELFLDLAAVCTDEEIDAFEKRAEDIRVKGDADKLLEDMAKKAYGDKYKEKIEEMTVAALEEVADLTLKMRKTYHDYMAGDPDTKKKVADFEKSAEYKAMIDEMEEVGFDFKAEASK